MSAVPTLLDPPQTNQQTPFLPPKTRSSDQLQDQNSETDLVTSRKSIVTAMKLAGRGVSSIERFKNCGAHPWVYQSTTQPTQYRLSSDRCESRFCPRCSQIRGSRIAENVQRLIRGHETRLITLTLRHSPDPLRTQIDRLYRCAKNLRRNPRWLSRVAGGIQVLEIKSDSTHTLFHPHLHMIVEGKFFPQPLLRSMWKDVTGDSHVVDVRYIKSTDQAVHYVTKYLSKPIGNPSNFSPEQLVNLLTDTKGVRFAFTFGSLKGSTTLSHDEPGKWTSVGPLSIVLEAFKQGATYAVEIVKQLVSNRELNFPYEHERNQPCCQSKPSPNTS